MNTAPTSIREFAARLLEDAIEEQSRQGSTVETNNNNGGLESGNECLTASVCPPSLESHNGGGKGVGIAA